MSDEQSGTSDGAILRKLASTWKTSKLETQMLRKHKWQLVEIEPVDVELPETCQLRESTAYKSESDDMESNQIRSAPSSPKNESKEYENEAAQLKEENSNVVPKDIRKLPPRNPSSWNKQYFDSSSPSRDNLNASSFGTYARGEKRRLPETFETNDAFPVRKPVCTNCWATDRHCDKDRGQCWTCCSDNVTCVRKLCDRGLECRNPRCPCLHPGQWDKKSPEWVVEGGQMPWKPRGDPRGRGLRGNYVRRETDSYRPSRA